MGKAYEGLGDKTNAVASYQEAGRDQRFSKWVAWKLDRMKQESE